MNKRRRYKAKRARRVARAREDFYSSNYEVYYRARRILQDNSRHCILHLKAR